MLIGRKYSLFIIILCLFVLACGGKPAVKPAEKFDPEKSFVKANEQLEKKNYEEARAAFLEVKNRDLTRSFAPLAQLKIADSYVQEEDTERAVAEYGKFLETYQIAMVYFNQIESPERGYSGAAKALEEFEKLKQMFPRNPYKEVVDLKIEKCRNTMAEYEFLVGKFYYHKGSYNAAVGRFEGLLLKYPDFKGEAEVLFLTGMSFRKLAQKDKASEYLTRFIQKYPNNKLAKDAKKALSSIK
jgi:outer membrane protein assembly factor BamD